jgi:hypothetical protein
LALTSIENIFIKGKGEKMDTQILERFKNYIRDNYNNHGLTNSIYISHGFLNWLWLMLKGMFVKKEGGKMDTS